MTEVKESWEFFIYKLLERLLKMMKLLAVLYAILVKLAGPSILELGLGSACWLTALGSGAIRITIVTIWPESITVFPRVP